MYVFLVELPQRQGATAEEQGGGEGPLHIEAEGGVPLQ